MILVELEAAVDQYGTTRKFYVATDAFVTSPTDTPANTAFLPVLKDPGDITVSAFSEGQTSGTSRLQQGDLVLTNVDGSFDAWKDYSFDGRPVIIRAGEGGEYPGDFRVILTGAVESLSATVESVRITLRDKAYILTLPVLTTQYAGTNSGPTGLEGLPGDIKGKVKPRVYGKVFNIAPPCVNTSKLTYQVSDRAVDAIDAVYDRAAALTAGSDHATSALLTAASVSAGTYDTCLAEGLFRLGSSPDGQVTADVTAGGSDDLRTVAQLLKALAIDAGISEASILSSDVGELNALAPYVVGRYLDDGTTFRAAMDEIAQSAGCWWVFDASGVLRMGQLANPTEPAQAYLLEAQVLEGFERGVADGAGIPVWRVTVNYKRFWTTQPTDVAGSVGDDRKAELAQEYRSVSAEDPAIKFQYAQARELVVDTLLTDEADATAEAARLLALHKVRRDLFEVPVPAEVVTDADIGLMSTLNLTHGRFGLSGGRTFLVLGRGLQLSRNRAVLNLWG